MRSSLFGIIDLKRVGKKACYALSNPISLTQQECADDVIALSFTIVTVSSILDNHGVHPYIIIYERAYIV